MTSTNVDTALLGCGLVIQMGGRYLIVPFAHKANAAISGGFGVGDHAPVEAEDIFVETVDEALAHAVKIHEQV